MKKTMLAIVTMAMVVCAQAAVQFEAVPPGPVVPSPFITNAPPVPVDSGSFMGTVMQYFTSFNTDLTNTFQTKGTMWTGLDSIQGGKTPLANEIGLSYNIWKMIGVESLTRDGGVAGTWVSQNVGVNANFVVIDTRLTLYLDAGYQLDDKTAKFKDNLFGEAGARVQKALTEHTFAFVGLGAQFPRGGRIFSAGAGFTF